MVRYLENRCQAESAFGSTSHLELPFADIVDGKIPIPPGSSFSIVRVAESPQVLVLEFGEPFFSSHLTLDRVSAYVEKFKKQKIPTLAESPRAGGTDLKLSDVADFFNACADQLLTLSPGEMALKAELIAQGSLTPVENGLLTFLQPQYRASSPQVLLSVIPAASQSYRKAVYAHEYSHALYFLDESFRSRVSKAYAALAPVERRFLQSMMVASGYYESAEPWLMETETQAHAIEPQFGNTGFPSLMAHAIDRCPASAAEAKDSACQDFLSYPPQLRDGLFQRLHDRFVELTKDRIPMVATLKPETEDGLHVLRRFQSVYPNQFRDPRD